MAPPTDSAYVPSCSSASSSVTQLTSTIQPSFVNTVNTFGLKILSSALDADPTKSAGLCSMNIYCSLSMIAAGSKDKNLAAFAQVLGFESKSLQSLVSDTLGLDNYSKTSSAVDLSSASAIFSAKDFVLEDSWKSLVSDKSKAEVGPLALSPINAFIERETRRNFKDLIRPDDLQGAVLMLVTCLYFKANWDKAFERKLTQENATFFGYNGEETPCDLMKRVETTEYVEDEKCQVAILPYKSEKQGPKWRAAIILPKKRGVSAMHDLITSFTTSPNLLRKTLLGSGGNSRGGSRGQAGSSAIPVERNKRVALQLPRFSLKLHLDLKPILSNLGLSPAFVPSGDFVPMSKDDLYLSRVTHDLFLDIDEKGTEMAAVTVAVMRRSIVQTTQMQVNRPFLFIVFDASTGLLLCESIVDLST